MAPAPAAIPEYAQSIVGRTEVIRVPERVAFFCVAMARHLFERLNGIDEGFGFGNFEDEDFCLRLQMLGYGVGVVTNAFVFHHGSRTFESNYVDHSQWMVQNLDRYVEKMDRSCTRFPSTRRRNGTIEQPVVSVIVRTRNRPADLRLALNSLMWQTSCQFEVVVVNDGGEDVEELLGLYANDMQIRYVNNQPGHGRSGAANDGAEAATGRFMTFLDDDDIVYPFHLASLVREAERVDAATPFVYSQYNRALVRGRGESASIIDRIHVPFWKFDRNDLLIGNQPPLHTWLLPRTLYESHGGFDPSFGILHDWDFLLRVTNETPLVGLPRATCQYRIYLDLNNSVSGGRRQALEELRNVYERHPAGSQKIKLRRRLEVAGLESQVALAEELNASVEHGGMTREEAARRYVASVFGFGVHGY